MYSFPHPQAIFDGGGIPFFKRAAGNYSSGTNIAVIDYLVFQNRVLHLKQIYALIALGGTSGEGYVYFSIADVNNNELARIAQHTVPFNATPDRINFSQTIDVLIPSNYKLRVFVVNTRDVSVYMEAHVCGIEYKVFRS